MPLFYVDVITYPLRLPHYGLVNVSLYKVYQDVWQAGLTFYRFVTLFWYFFLVNTLRPRQNGRHFIDNIFNCIFWNESIWILIKISLKFVPKGPISNIPALVQIMAWRRLGDKLLSEPMMVRLSTYICVTRPQWVNLKLTIYHYSDVAWASWRLESPTPLIIKQCAWSDNKETSQPHITDPSRTQRSGDAYSVFVS